MSTESAMPIARPESMPRPSHLLLGWACAVGLLSAPLPGQAQGFAAYITPPRFEVKVSPGQSLRQVLEI